MKVAAIMPKSISLAWMSCLLVLMIWITMSSAKLSVYSPVNLRNEFKNKVSYFSMHFANYGLGFDSYVDCQLWHDSIWAHNHGKS